MNHSFTISNASAPLVPTELELLHILCAEEESVYPWLTTPAESEAYWTTLEQEAAEFEDWSETALAQGASQFYTHLDHLLTLAVSQPLTETISYRFPSLIPKAIIEAIAMKAEQVVSTSQSLTHQLINCVREVIPQWETEDLEVLARHFAFSMRGPELENAIDQAVENVRPLDWNALSEVEQARLSLAVACYSLEQLHTQG